MKNYFSDYELRCKCCDALVVDEDFLRRLNNARMIAGFPFVITSGYRCPKHNAEVGSTSTNHTSGKAADIQCLSDNERYRMLNALIIAGMMGIGVGKDFIHADTNRLTLAVWTY
jgi:zinc D-Ala-D-Ala carboxypeptidase